MAPKGKACDECTTNCLTIHHKQKDPSPTVTRFIIPMIGENYSEFLYLPPKFARTAKDLAGEETLLEDALGQKWNVKLSSLNGDLAFREGWPKFFQDHHLEEGDLVVFNYLKGGHFIVQVYGASGCETTDFRKPRRQENKRSIREQTGMQGEDTPMGVMHTTPVDVHSGNRAFPLDTVSPSKLGSRNAEVEDAVMPAELGVERYEPVSHRTRGKQSKGCSTSQLDAGEVPPTGRKRGRMAAPAAKVHSIAAGTFTVEIKSQSYLELPVRIPSFSGKRESQQRKVVYLRDPTGRLWPLLYHGETFFKVFTGNWTRFCEANNIKPGDICSFQVEDRTSCTYTVNIVHKSGQFTDE